jgi:N-acetylmuramoyl-L-alanine amidase
MNSKTMLASFGVLAMLLASARPAAAAPPAPLPTPQDRAPLSAQTDINAGADSYVHLTIKGDNLTFPTQTIKGDTYIKTIDADRFFNELGYTSRWSEDRTEYTVYGPKHYARFRCGVPTYTTDSRDFTGSQPALTVIDNAAAISLKTLAQALDFRLVPGSAPATYTFMPVVEKVEMARDASGASKIVVTGSGPLQSTVIHNNNITAVSIVGAAWGPKESVFQLEDAWLQASGSGTPEDPLVLIIETPAYWRADESQLLPNEIDLALTPSYRPTDNQVQALSNLSVVSGYGEKDVILTSTGPIQDSWHYDKDTHTLTVDVPQAQIVGHTSVAPNCSEIVSVDGKNMMTPYFPVARLQIQLRPGYEPNVSTSTVAGTTTLLVKVAAVGIYPMQGNHGASFTTGYVDRGWTGGPVHGTVVIDPGHGGSDPGAINRWMGLCEKDVTLDICHNLQRILEGRGLHVAMTRTDDRDVSWAHSPDKVELGMRAHVAEASHADIFVSIHCNSAASSSYNGTSYHWCKACDLPLAQELNGCLATGALNFVNHGPVRNNFYVLRHTDIPAVLIETAFISNPSDASRLADAAARNKIAESIADRLCEYMARHGGSAQRPDYNGGTQ